eukprot:SAG31_NODE_195_length_20708_cov_9.627638_16_plen_81_part_00
MRVWKLEGSLNSADMQEEEKLKVTKEEKLDAKEPAWRVQWNITGTMLASSGVSYVRLWTCDPLDGSWVPHSEKKVEPLES